jgi:nucleoside-diphosphate-sugar epimerase
MFFKLYGLPVVNLRIFMTYGPGQEVGKLIPYVILSLLRQQAPKLSSAMWEGDWVYIDDVIRGLIAAAHVQGIAGTTIELGSGSLVSTRKIVEHLLELTRSRIAPAFGALPDRPLEQVRVADVVQTYRTLGWRPSISLVEGLQRTIDGYAQTIKDGLT